jgi:hypothetical protein
MKHKFNIGDQLFYFETWKKPKEEEEYLASVIPLTVKSIILEKDQVSYYSHRTGHCISEEKLFTPSEALEKFTSHVNKIK